MSTQLAVELTLTEFHRLANKMVSSYPFAVACVTRSCKKEAY